MHLQKTCTFKRALSLAQTDGRRHIIALNRAGVRYSARNPFNLTPHAGFHFLAGGLSALVPPVQDFEVFEIGPRSDHLRFPSLLVEVQRCNAWVLLNPKP